jgi:glutaconate CoA-transferase subunit A
LSEAPNSAARTVTELVAHIGDGDRIVAGGLPLWRKPLDLVRAIADAGHTALTYSCFLASLDAEILVAAGCLAELEYGYVGRDVMGASHVMGMADGFTRRTPTEFEYWAAVRATATGVAHLPDAFDAPVEAAHYDVCLLHASLADADGNIYSLPLDAMEEDDRLLASAAERVLVSVERQVTEVAADAVLLLPARDVTAFAVCPGGARPLGMAGFYAPAPELFDLAAAATTAAAR